MHPQNPHSGSYDFDRLITSNPDLARHVFGSTYGSTTIDFSNPDAVFQLNKGLLKSHYNLEDWVLPEGYLCPPIPSRADYICYLNDLLLRENKEKTSVKGLDIGVGANCIYPIIGSQLFGWHMVGSDISETAVKNAMYNVSLTKDLSNHIEIRYQPDNAFIFKNSIQPNEQFTFSMCNPPFFKSAKDAERESLRKIKNLHGTTDLKLNFGGQANELYCNGGETLFIKRMIKESVHFKTQVSWFTTLVSRKEHLPKLEKQLKRLNAAFEIIPMSQGHKRSRILAWQFA